MQFKDQDIVNCALLSLKHLRIMAAYMTEESGTDELFQKEIQVLDTLTQLQRDTYDFMIDNNWMSVSFQTKSSVDKTAKQLRKKVDELA